MATVTVLYVLAAVLPIIGFGRLLWRVQRKLSELDARAERQGGTPRLTWNDMGEDMRVPYRQERRDLVWDIALVGVGLIAGAVASVWSLHL
ncbi:hypothetical protein [Isoptericola sp. NPDC057559]|uniref:hypothetical protein n=1 Tax=Isoptericola sp. NPDC057559 TaxID=3346168 RepID=UPI0036B10E41